MIAPHRNPGSLLLSCSRSSLFLDGINTTLTRENTINCAIAMAAFHSNTMQLIRSHYWLIRIDCFENIQSKFNIICKRNEHISDVYIPQNTHIINKYDTTFFSLFGPDIRHFFKNSVHSSALSIRK